MGPRTSSTPSHPAPSAWRNHVSSGVLLDDDLLADLKSVDQHEHIHWRLPLKPLSAGGVLGHSIHVVTALLTKHAPMIFKVGFTHSPTWRWENRLYGYRWQRDKWKDMCVLHISEEECGPAMLEAALIEKFKGIVAAPTACYITLHALHF